MPRSKKSQDVSVTPATIKGRASVPPPTVFVSAGFALPAEFSAHEELVDGVTVDIDVKVSGDRALAHRVAITADAGVSSTMLRKVEVRQIVTRRCLEVLQRANAQPDGTIRLTPAEDNAEAHHVVHTLIGYVEARGKDGRLTELRGGDVGVSVKPARRRRRS